MWIQFDYPGYEDIDPFEIPDRNFMDIFGPRSMGAVDEDRIISRAFSQPIGSQRLRDRVSRERQVLILILADVAQIRDHADCIMLSPGVKRDEAEQLGFRWAKNGDDALKLAFDRQGRNASVAVLRHGGHVLPLAGPRSG